MNEGTLNFSYSGEFIQDLARTAYWFENRREWAIRVLKCLRMPRELDEDQLFYMRTRGLDEDQIAAVSPSLPLDDEQIQAVLEGRATLSEDSKFQREPDRTFQAALGQRRVEAVEVGGRMVNRGIIEKYLASVERSRNANESHPAYEEVLKEAGFLSLADYRGRKRAVTRNDPESLEFRSALLKLAGTHMRLRERLNKAETIV